MTEPNDRTALDDPRWSEVRRMLKAAEDEDGSWWDKNEIREAIVRANAMDIEPATVLACYQACSSRAGLTRRIDSLAGRKRRVLAIDDEQAVLDGVKLNLESTRRYEVRTESDPDSAVGAALAYEPDILLIDVVMPGKSGMDLLEEIRSHETLGEVPAIMVTALADGLDSSGVVSDGMLYLSKPVTTKKLMYCIEELVKVGAGAV